MKMKMMMTITRKKRRIRRMKIRRAVKRGTKIWRRRRMRIRRKLKMRMKIIKRGRRRKRGD